MLVFVKYRCGEAIPGRVSWSFFTLLTVWVIISHFFPDIRISGFEVDCFCKVRALRVYLVILITSFSRNRHFSNYSSKGVEKKIQIQFSPPLHFSGRGSKSCRESEREREKASALHVRFTFICLRLDLVSFVCLHRHSKERKFARFSASSKSSFIYRDKL